MRKYVAKEEGHYISMGTGSNSRELIVYESLHLKAGDKMVHPPGATIMLVVASPDPLDEKADDHAH